MTARATGTSLLPDRSWRALLRIGGVAGLLVVVSGASALALYAAAPPPVAGGAATLRFIADHRAAYVAQQLLWLVPAAFGVVVLTALVVALLPTDRSLAVLGGVVGGAAWTALLAVPVTSEGALPLVTLSDTWATAPSAARPGLVAGAEAFIAENGTISLPGVLTPLGVLLISLPLIRGPLPRWIGWLGIGTGGLGLVSEALRFVVPTLYAAYGPLLWVWFAAVGVALLRLPTRPPTASEEPTERRSYGRAS